MNSKTKMAARKPVWTKAWKTLKKQALLDAVLHVFSQQGVHGLTMDNVALEAGVAKGTLYAYFENKQELLKTAIEAGIAPLIEELNQLLESDLTPIEKLQQLTLRHLAYCDAHRNFFRILLYDRQAVQERIRRYKSSLYSDFLERTSKVVSAGMKDGSLLQANPLLIASMLIESNIAVIHQRLQAENPGPVENDARCISNVFLFGIADESLKKKRSSHV
jgi:AcrR family transcriptional regulator